MVGYPACVNGKSMQPMFNFSQETSNSHRYNFSSWRNSAFRLDLDWVFVNCWAARNFEFKRGDIVVFVSPKDPYDYVIKRLIAQEGDILSSYRYERSDLLIPEGHCWVEGDNWDNSVDSNRYGPIPKGLVFGVATHVIWPPHKWQKITPSIPSYLLPERVKENNNELLATETCRSWLTNLKILFYFIKN
jgi:inner membrane protease subunit 2